jgi:hypothetical protein
MSSTHSASAEHRAAVANLLMELPEDAAFSSTPGQTFVTLPRINQTLSDSSATTGSALFIAQQTADSGRRSDSSHETPGPLRKATMKSKA